jgi:hypothetical protein
MLSKMFLANITKGTAAVCGKWSLCVKYWDYDLQQFTPKKVIFLY